MPAYPAPTDDEARAIIAVSLILKAADEGTPVQPMTLSESSHLKDYGKHLARKRVGIYGASAGQTRRTVRHLNPPPMPDWMQERARPAVVQTPNDHITTSFARPFPVGTDVMYLRGRCRYKVRGYVVETGQALIEIRTPPLAHESHRVGMMFTAEPWRLKKYDVPYTHAGHQDVLKPGDACWFDSLPGTTKPKMSGIVTRWGIGERYCEVVLYGMPPRTVLKSKVSRRAA